MKQWKCVLKTCSTWDPEVEWELCEREIDRGVVRCNRGFIGHFFFFPYVHCFWSIVKDWKLEFLILKERWFCDISHRDYIDSSQGELRWWHQMTHRFTSRKTPPAERTTILSCYTLREIVNFELAECTCNYIFVIYYVNKHVKTSNN